jgi:hypothetical protein
MAMHESIKPQSCRVQITNGVAAALANRFCRRDTAAAADDVMITHVPPAAGAPAQGILAMRATSLNTRTDETYLATTSYVRPDGCEATVELAEAVTQRGAPLRIGGNGAEVDGAAYLADAVDDYIVGYAAELGVVGQIIRFEFINAGLVAA